MLKIFLLNRVNQMSKKQSDNRYTPASYKQANSSGSAAKSLKSKKAMIISLIAVVAVAVIVVSACARVVEGSYSLQHRVHETGRRNLVAGYFKQRFQVHLRGRAESAISSDGDKLDETTPSWTPTPLWALWTQREDEWNGKVVYDLGTKGLEQHD